MELQKRSFRPPSSLRTLWMSVWVAFSGGGGVQHPSPRRSENVVGVCLGGIRCSGSPRTSWVSVWVACNGAAGEELPSTKQSENVVEVCLGCIHQRWRSAASVAQAVRKCCGCLSGLHSLEVEECSIRRPGGPETSWVSVWVAFVAQAVRERRGCLSGWHAMELQKRSFRRPSSLRTSWKYVWVACNRIAEEELPSPKQSENVVDVCLGCIFRRWRSAASVAQAVRKRRGCLSGWHSLLRQSENVVGVCLGGLQWSCRRGASVDQAV